MSLKVWLPLNGNLKNQGLSNIIPSGTPTFLTDGKIGQCISLTPRVSFTGLPEMHKFTILFWLKVDSCTSDWADSLSFSTHTAEGTSGTVFRFEATKTSRACSFHNNTTYAITSGSRILITNSQYGEWHHCGFAYNGEECYTYIDGIKTYTDAGLGGSIHSYFHIGETNNIVGGMNDLRIYDECLSQKQIKEIANGLVCHYKMTMSAINENLLLESNSPNRHHNTTSYPCGTYNLKQNVINGEKYTVSINVTIEQAYKIAIYFGGGTYTPGWITCPEEDGTYTITQTFTANANQAAQTFINVYVRDSQDQAKMGNARCIIHWIKLEKGEQATSYVNDAFKINETLLNDCSGNNYSLNQKGDLILNYDSPRYDNSITFPGLNLNYLYRDKFDWLTAPFTFNCWCNQISRTAEAGTSTTTLQFVESQGRDCGYAGFSLCVANGKPRLYLGTSTSGTYWGINSNEEIELNTWHMLTGTYDGTTAKLYVDGILKASQNSEAPISWEQANGFTIGKMAYNHTSAQNYFPFNGNISDVRIYATALSTEEILTLYKNSGIIDNNGNVYTREFKEV